LAGGEQKEQGQAGTTTQQGVHAVAAQQRTRMVVWRMADRGIGVGATPGENGSAIDNDIPPTHQARVTGELHQHDKEQLVRRRAHTLPAFG
jgi:hypothetical protein